MSSNLGSNWTDERIDLMKSLWAQGLSASIIAQRLGGGVSRSAVCGKLFRLNVRSRPLTTHEKLGPPKVKHNDKNRGGGLGRNIRNRTGKAFAEKRKPAPIEAPPTEPISLDIPLLALQSNHCRWPHGNGPFLFCGQPTGGGLPYCRHHSLRAYQPGSRGTNSVLTLTAAG